MLVNEIRKIQKETQPQRDMVIEEKTLQLFREVKAELIQAAKDPMHTKSNLTIRIQRHPMQCWKNVAAILLDEGFKVEFDSSDSYLNISW